LKRGDRVAVVAPASPFSRQDLNRGLRFMKGMGLVPVPGEHLFHREAYLAGSDEMRAADLLWALESSEIKAVFFARGGYGSLRIATKLMGKRLRPKIVMGFSDNCALLLALLKQFVVFHGPHVCSPAFSRPTTRFSSWLRKSLMTPEPLGFLPGKLKVLKHGRAKGRLLACNLSMLVSALSTPVEPDLSGKILVIEETNEPPYRIDRMLTQLRISERLSKAKAIVFGNMGVPLNKLRTALAPLLDEFSGPILWGASIGHIRDNLPIPLGMTADLTSDIQRIKILESATL